MTAMQFLVEWAIRSCALILGGTLLLWALCVKQSSVRLAALTAMLCTSAAMPLLTLVLPKVPLIRLAMPRRPARLNGAWETGAVGLEHNAAASGQSKNRSTRLAAGSSGNDWQHFTLSVYLLLTSYFLLRLSAGLFLSGRLRRRSRATGRRIAGIEVRESDDVSAPLSLGVVATAIVLPNDWCHWDGDKLDAVLEHERSHILRRDPTVLLLSAIHRAVLWYSPAAWYLHRRIVRAAEEASDDAAVSAARDRASYAELLLEFMQRSRRDRDWEGVAMARYAWHEERIHRILDGTAPARGVSRHRIAAILTLGSLLAFIAAAGHLRPAEPDGLRFQAASIRLSPPGSRPGPVRALPAGDGYTVQDAPVKLLVSLIYKVPMLQIQDGPNWLEADGYDIEAKADHARSMDQLHAMFRNLLADRFKLKFHKEIKHGPVYALTVEPSGSKMKVNTAAEFFDYPVKFTAGKRWLTVGTRVSMEYFCWWLGQELQKDARPVIDQTGLNQNYDFSLSFAPPGVPKERLPEQLRDRPSLFEALTGQLGLKLQATMGPVEYLVVDHVERPGSN